MRRFADTGGRWRLRRTGLDLEGIASTAFAPLGVAAERDQSYQAGYSITSLISRCREIRSGSRLAVGRSAADRAALDRSRRLRGGRSTLPLDATRSGSVNLRHHGFWQLSCTGSRQVLGRAQPAVQYQSRRLADIGLSPRRQRQLGLIDGCRGEIAGCRGEGLNSARDARREGAPARCQRGM